MIAGKGRRRRTREERNAAGDGTRSPQSTPSSPNPFNRPRTTLFPAAKRGFARKRDLEDHLVGAVALGEAERGLEVLGQVLGLLDGGDDRKVKRLMRRPR